MVYEWKPGTRYRTDAGVAGAVCEKLEAAGNLTAKSLLDVSRPETAPLHSEFEWDDSIAAERFREDQARGIIRHLVVRLENKPEETVRGFFKIKVTDQETYTRTETIMIQPDMRSRLLEQALNELDMFKNKYNTIKELSGVFDAIESVKRIAIQRRIQERVDERA